MRRVHAVSASAERGGQQGVVDDPPHHLGPAGQRCGLHADHRADRWFGDRRAGAGLPAEQRADRLQLHPDARNGARSKPAGSRQTAPFVDEPHDRSRRRQACPGSGFAGRLDDHHHGAADAAQPARLRIHVARRRCRSARVTAKHRLGFGRAGVLRGLGGGAAWRADTRSSAWPRSELSRRSNATRMGCSSPWPSRCGVVAATRGSSDHADDYQRSPSRQSQVSSAEVSSAIVTGST